jgi:hypothetical protein
MPYRSQVRSLGFLLLMLRPLLMICVRVICVEYPRRSDYTGKEHCPILAWNVCVAHTTRISNVHGHNRVLRAPRKEWTGAFKGATNGKRMVSFVDVVAGVMTLLLLLMLYMLLLGEDRPDDICNCDQGNFRGFPLQGLRRRPARHN